MTIEEIKQQLTLSQVLHFYHLTPDKNQRLCCPFHDDKTPSLQIYHKTNTAYCFSSNCKTHGKSLDVIDFIMHKESITKREAILKAKLMINGGGATAANTPYRIETLTNIFIYFKNGVSGSKQAKEYIESRCLDYTKTEIGYNSGQFHHGKRKDEDLIKSCIKYGILLDQGTKSRTGNPAYKSFGKWCIVFPLKNENGDIVSLYFRSTLADKKQRHFYLKDRQGLYPSYPKKVTKKLILTESIIDAASLMEQEGIKSKYEILSLYGTNGLTEEHLKAIQSIEDLEEIIFFLNGDSPGIKAVEKYTPMLRGYNPKTKITSVEVPENEDVNSLLQSHPSVDGHGSSEILIHLIESRKECTFLFSSEKSTESLSSARQINETNELVQSLEKEQETQEGNHPSGLPYLNANNPYNLKHTTDEVEYRIKGFKTDQLDSLKASIQIVNLSSKRDHRVKLDLYEYKQIKSIANAVSERLELRNDIVVQDLSELTELLEEYRDKEQHQSKHYKPFKIQVPTATASKCIEFLKGEKLLQKINGLVGKAGITGEETNRILLFAIASSYKMPDTLHGLIQGSSGSGKTRLLKVISELMPPEEVKKYTRVTDNSFYNQDEYFFVNKLVCFEDMDGLKEEAQLAVRELQSNEILISSTSVKDKNGSISGGERIVRGPIASMSCTTKGEMYEDNISRCFLIAVDESKEQTLKVIDYQNKIAAGLIDRSEEKKVKEFVQNCIRLLKPYQVINPYAHKIKLPESAHKIRRLNELYQSFVRQITLLNQYQRKKDAKGRLITDKEDLQTACDILFESIILKVDELDGCLRQFFEKLKSYVDSKGKDYEFNRFEVRKATGVSKTQQHYYISRLVDLEYLRQFGFANRGYKYKISHWDNMAANRAMIKDELYNQLQEI
jgi:DNA primase